MNDTTEAPVIPLALVRLDHCDIVITAHDHDGVGFYVTTENDAVTSDPDEWGFQIRVGDDVDAITCDDIDALRVEAVAGFRDDADTVTLGSHHCSLVAEIIRGAAPAPWSAEVAA